MNAFDYVGRTGRIQVKAKAEGVDCVIVMRPANIRYLTGYWGYATRAEYFEPRRLIALIVPRSGRPLLITPKIEFEFARQATKGLPIEIRRHVEWKEEGETEDSWGIARSYLKALGITSGKIAFERQHLTLRATTALEQAFEKFAFADAAGWVDDMRAVKDQLEIGLMRRCGTLAVEMYELQANALKEKRWREYELAMHGLEHVVHRCAADLEGTDVNSPIGDGVQLITSGPRLARAHGSASCREIQPSDVVMFDFCRVPYLLGYRMAMGRVVSLRKLNSEERDIEAVIDKSYTAGVAMCRPGASCSDIDSTIRGILVDAKLARHIVHRNGRGVGIEAVESPEIKEGSADRLKAGMIISIEPSIYREGFAARIENTLLITADGTQLLTPAPSGIRVLEK
jgi:Xaa-Pro aminopeptidase